MEPRLQLRRDALARGSRFARVFLLEFLDAPCRVDDLLFAGVERMAVRAHLDVQLAGERGTRLELVAATADDVYLFVFRVNLGFHGICLWVAAVTERVQLSLTARGVASVKPVSGFLRRRSCRVTK